MIRSWITDDNLVFIRQDGDTVNVREHVSIVNRYLDEGDFGLRVTNEEYLFGRCRSTIWVNPEAMDKERWDESNVSRVRQDGWTQLFRVDLEAVDGW